LSGKAAGQWGDGVAGLPAKDIIARAILIDPIAPRAYYIRGLWASDDDSADAAKRWCQQALKLDPQFTPALARLGELVWNQGEIAEAIRLIEQAIRIETRAPWMRYSAKRPPPRVPQIEAAR
jgi:tetratricopeptide (TPR) repeat protein